MKQRKFIIDSVFSKFYTDPYSKDGWRKIELSVGVFGSTKLIGTGATPSKPSRQGDGQFTPYMLDKSNIALVSMYQTGLQDNLFITPEDMEVRYLSEWDVKKQIENTMRWNAICSAYEVIEEIVKDTYLLLASLLPLYRYDTFIPKTPAQLYFYGGDGCIGKYQKDIPILPYYNVETETYDSATSLLPYYLEHMYKSSSDILYGPLWVWYESFRSNDPNKDLLGAMLNDPNDIWYMDIPNILEPVTKVQHFTNIPYHQPTVNLNEIGIMDVPVISNIVINNPDDLPLSIVASTSDYNVIFIDRGQHPILEESVSFTVTYNVSTIA